MLPAACVRHIARLVLAWFVLSIGVAVAAPLVSPQALEIVCSASGSKLVLHTEEGAVDLNAAQMHCPMCIPTGAPPPLAVLAPDAPPLPPFALPLAPARWVAGHAAPPWQARAPPISS
ncbi:hypothetical protein [Ottowia testudinis]|uniref:DUF2946 domain-containing protein n=1 Tax=Ottowia testudinis TaxID=2816950 RepID=A0A975H3C9_9BURK|nr:hypothetical protein [Ottowia testudinis]QTD45135.1 hypothetical protein J1M35_19275 [Ottowia testudinis]